MTSISLDVAMMPTEAKRQQRAVLIVVLATYMMILLDTYIVITGLPEISSELGFSAVMLSWVQTSYMLAFGGFLMLGARAGDLFGRRRVFLAGLTLFTLSSLVIGAAPNAAALLAAPAKRVGCQAHSHLFAQYPAGLLASPLRASEDDLNLR